jgi:hypothetical protein
MLAVLSPRRLGELGAVGNLSPPGEGVRLAGRAGLPAACCRGLIQMNLQVLVASSRNLAGQPVLRGQSFAVGMDGRL